MNNKFENNDLIEDLRLLRRYKEGGSQEDLMLFFKKYMSLIYGVCLKYLKNVESSKDAVMDIYEKLVKKLLKHDVEHPKAWLYTLTKNHCYEVLRRKSRVLEKENDAFLMYSDDVFRLDDSEDLERDLGLLNECLDKLEQMQKRCISLFYLEKKTYKEVTSVLDIKWNKARSLIQNGRRNLKNCMEKKYESIKEK